MAASVTPTTEMTEREVWELAAAIVVELSDEDLSLAAGRLGDLLRGTAAPENWRRVAAAVDAIASASKQ